MALGIRQALELPTERSVALASIAASLPDTRVRDGILLAVSLGDVGPAVSAQALGSSGFVAESVPLALYLGFGTWRSVVDALHDAALVSEDADTVASMVGQLLGAAGHSVPPGPDVPDLGIDVDKVAARLAAIGAATGSSGGS